MHQRPWVLWTSAAEADKATSAASAFTPNERRLLYTEVATQTLRQLVQHGSRIQHLRFIPMHDYMEGEADEVGHIWPRYAFERGTVFVDSGGVQELIRTIAVPNPENVPKKR